MSDYLCEELMIEIFTRLPPKSLLRFRSVSKSLRSCIDSPDFIRIHTRRSPQRLVMTHLVHFNYIEEFGDVDFCTLHAEDQLPLCPIRGYIGISAVKFPDIHVIIVGSCNGILCLLNKIGIFTLWNPTIKRQLTIPDCPRSCTHDIGIGFGFDPINDDNKIVVISACGEKVESSFIYAVKTGDWCPIASPVPFYSKVVSRACYLNGILHWVVERSYTDSRNKKLRYIMTFNLSTHVFGMIGLPEPSGEIQKLTTIQGSLAVVSSWIWVMRDASWYVVFSSDRNQVGPEVMKVLKVLELNSNGDLLFDTFCDGLQVYNHKTGELSRLVDFNHTSSLYEIDEYVESLWLLDMGNACEVNQLFLQEKQM